MRAAAALLALLAACAARPHSGLEPPPPEAVRGRLEAGFRHLRAGRAQAALAEAGALLARHPWWVEAHRLAQDARRALLQSGPLLRDYTGLAEANPGRPEAWYLLARISGPARRQEQLFAQALALQPEFPRALAGLAWVLAGRGEREQALALLERAAALEPGTLDLPLALADRLVEGGAAERERALEWLERLARDAPGDPRPLLRIAALDRKPTGLLAGLKAALLEPEAQASVAGLAAHLEQAGESAAGAARLWLERLAAGSPPLSLQARVLLARLRNRAGDPAGAFALLGAVDREAALEGDDRELLGTLAFAAGRKREGLEALLEWLPEGFPLSGPTAAARAGLLRALAGEDLDGVPALLAGAGFPEAARAAGAAGGEELARAEEARLIESALALLLENGEPSGRDLHRLLRELRALSLALLGRDAVGTPRLISVFGAGTYLDPGGPGLPAFLLERGRMLFLGQRLGRPPEAYSGRLVSFARERLAVAGREVPIRCWLVEGSGIRPSQGLADLAGLALGRDCLIDLDAIRSWAGALRRQAARGIEAGVLGQPLAPASGPQGLWSPSDLAVKLVVLALAEEGPAVEQRLFEIVRQHELAHLADAALHLPPQARLARLAGLLLRSGLSPARVEAELETRAQASALARTRWPRLALAQAAGSLPAGADGQGSVHDVGYARLVWALGKDAPGGIGALFRLEPEELGRRARAVAERLGLPVFEVAPATEARSPCGPEPPGSCAG